MEFLSSDGRRSGWMVVHSNGNGSRRCDVFNMYLSRSKVKAKATKQDTKTDFD